jgi:hypothetical protein
MSRDIKRCLYLYVFLVLWPLADAIDIAMAMARCGVPISAFALVAGL